MDSTSITGPLLYAMCFIAGAALVVETGFGLLWAFGGDIRTYASLFQ